MQAVVVGFILSVKLGLNALDPVGRGKKAEYQVTDDDVQVRGVVTCYISLLQPSPCRPLIQDYMYILSAPFFCFRGANVDFVLKSLGNPRVSTNAVWQADVKILAVTSLCCLSPVDITISGQGK